MPKFTYVPKDYSRDAIIYLAGIVDGEGALVISKHSSKHKSGYNYQARLEISNTVKGLCDWIQKNFGGTVSAYTRNQTPKNARKTVYRWLCQGERLTHICELIYPFSVIKQEEIKTILEMRYRLQKPVSFKGKQGVQSLQQSELDARHQLFLKLKSLHNRSYVNKK